MEEYINNAISSLPVVIAAFAIYGLTAWAFEKSKRKSS